jgi:4-phospho-D-threonate 3-dehydrogenase / 4-phospho-D-erythronate 3-dehydrogenase
VNGPDDRLYPGDDQEIYLAALVEPPVEESAKIHNRRISRWVTLALLVVVLGPVAWRWWPKEVARWYSALATERQLDGDAAAAEQALTAALWWDPESAALHLQRGDLLTDQGQYERALEDYCRALELNPEDVANRIKRSIALQYLGRHAEAVEDWLEIKAALEGRGQAAFALALNGLAYARALGNTDLDVALEEVNQALQFGNRSPEVRAAMLDTRGYIQVLRGEYEAALPRIAVTMGDPAGVGPELCLRLLDDADVAVSASPWCSAMRRVAASGRGDWPAAGRADHSRDRWAEAYGGLERPAVLDLQCIRADEVTPGRVDARCGDGGLSVRAGQHRCGVGRASRRRLDRSVEQSRLARRRASLSRAHGDLRPADGRRAVLHDAVFRAGDVQFRHGACRLSRGASPAEPRADSGRDPVDRGRAAAYPRPGAAAVGLRTQSARRRGRLFGQGEEERSIVPAVEQARARGWDVTGPVPGDTAFIPAARQQYDAVVCMYHDQGHIPVKMIAFDTAVNTTLGLPVPRTSVDHGTAFDIAWQGRAEPGGIIPVLGRRSVRLGVAVVGPGDRRFRRTGRWYPST